MQMDAKRTKVTNRIHSLERAIRIANEYLEKDEHADWHGFRPLFVRKLKDGKEVPPHKAWVKNAYLPDIEKRLARAEKVLERLASKSAFE